MAPLGIIAGLGQLPVQVAEAAVQRGQGVYIVRLKGFIEPLLDQYPGDICGVAEIGKILKSFKQAGCIQVCFAGIVKRPDLSSMKPDLKGISLLPKVLVAARKGDDALLRIMVETFEAEGFEIVGADKVGGPTLAHEGVIAGALPDADQYTDLRKAAHVALEIGRLDIGQGAIVVDGLVLCVEAQEGTQAMLERCTALDKNWRGTAENPRGVLVKRPKPIQERRVDLPTIGTATVESAAAAGLAGIGVEAGGVLLLDAESIGQRAEALGVFIYGFDKDWP